ncbi:Myb/SANT-like DNA-binding domain [Popillia japonica]|uniref:Regulatory protein zeste n=1 Tax=Popillia japonica TaxID=7064 RepID=A0AAW1IVP3_POPJA
MEAIARVRSANFTERKKQVLLSIVNKYKHIIENKKPDIVSNNDKTTTWLNIAEEFNSQSPNFVTRSVQSLRKYYEHLKKSIKKELQKTGVRCMQLVEGNQTKAESAKSDSTRRRAPVRAFTSSVLGEKYQMLVEKKLEYMECLKEDHKLRCEALQLYIEIKKKQLQLL